MRIFSSIFLVMSSPSFLISWVGLELNTLVFLPIMLNKKLRIISEASVKYFLTQTLASILIILRAFFFFFDFMILGNLILLCGLAIKLGAAPFHSWILSVAETLRWLCLFILLTVQKINPLLILWGFIEYDLGLIDTLIILSLCVGGLLGLVQTRTRLLITFSSINNLGWLLVSLSFDLWLGVLYFFIYIVVLLPVILIFDTFNISHINEFVLVNFNSSKQIFIFLSILSLGGLPPFLGFLPKWLILQNTIRVGWYFFRFFMILARLFTLFFYLRIIFSSFIINRTNLLFLNFTYSLNNLITFTLSLSIFGLFLFLFI